MSWRAKVAWVWVACWLLALCGCWGHAAPKVALVEGRVTLGGKPIGNGRVSFRPDFAKGNKSGEHPTGAIDADGKYRVYTGGRPGAPPGWYKVLVFIDEPPPPGEHTSPLAPKSLIDVKFQNELTTPLAVEVVDQPSAAAYDLEVTK